MTRDELIVASYWVLFICAPAGLAWALLGFSRDGRTLGACIFLVLAVLADHGLRIWSRMWGGGGTRVKSPAPARADDEEGDIADDPVLSAVHDDLGSVDRTNDHWLAIALVACVAAVYGFNRAATKSPWLDALGIAAVLGIIGFTIWRAIREKRRVAVKHGLRCRACGHTPGAAMVMSAAMTGRCAKCGASLGV